MLTSCEHVSQVRDVSPDAEGCSECLAAGSRWVHLRECLTCGHVACCDSSPNKHARKHWHATQHPIIRSFEPGEDWQWCYADDDYLAYPAAQPGAPG
jgi:uncharacterized UBP type Zn finger protein